MLLRQSFLLLSLMSLLVAVSGCNGSQRRGPPESRDPEAEYQAALKRAEVEAQGLHGPECRIWQQCPTCRCFESDHAAAVALTPDSRDGEPQVLHPPPGGKCAPGMERGPKDWACAHADRVCVEWQRQRPCGDPHLHKGLAAFRCSRWGRSSAGDLAVEMPDCVEPVGE